eukprot:6193213-Pleurochrysis_carterae.AAC.4
MVTSAAGPPATRSATFCATGVPTSGNSVATIPRTRMAGAFAHFRLPTVSTPGSAATLDAISPGTGTASIVPPAASINRISSGPSRVVRWGMSRPSVKYTRPSPCFNKLSAPFTFQPSSPRDVKSTGVGWAK